MKPPAGQSTIRPIKGIVTKLTVSTYEADEISDELAQGIIEHLEHEGQLPRRTISMVNFSVGIQPASWNVTVGKDRFDCHVLGDSMEIRRVRDDKS
jgi:hypothetical protein